LPIVARILPIRLARSRRAAAIVAARAAIVHRSTAIVAARAAIIPARAAVVSTGAPVVSARAAVVVRVSVVAGSPIVAASVVGGTVAIVSITARRTAVARTAISHRRSAVAAARTFIHGTTRGTASIARRGTVPLRRTIFVVEATSGRGTALPLGGTRRTVLDGGTLDVVSGTLRRLFGLYSAGRGGGFSGPGGFFVITFTPYKALLAHADLPIQ
jgi:hypothetical protein